MKPKQDFRYEVVEIKCPKTAENHQNNQTRIDKIMDDTDLHDEKKMVLT